MSRESLQLKELNGREDATAVAVDVDAEHRPDVSRRASNAALGRAAVQMRAGGQRDEQSIHAAAEQGVQSPAGELPHMQQIQRAFGGHDVSGIQAHVGDGSAQAMGAEAYATGNHVAFAQQPDLHTAAHEAAHVVQQRQGVQLKGGVGAADDSYERNADAVADRVVQGKSAEDLLGPAGETASAAPAGAVQHKKEKKPADPKKADETSDVASFGALSSSLKLLAEMFFERAAELQSLVNGPHNTNAGTGPAERRIAQIFENTNTEASHVAGMLKSYNVDGWLLQQLSGDVKLVLSGYSRFAMHWGPANSFLQARGDKTNRNVYWIKQVVDGLSETLYGQGAPVLQGEGSNPVGTETSARKTAITDHIEAAVSAAQSVEAGNAGETARLSRHVAELTWLARGHMNEMKEHKKELATLKATLKALQKSHPELEDLVEKLEKEIKALY